MHVLSQIKLFHGLRENDLTELYSLAFPLNLNANEFVFEEGSLGHQLYVLLNGQVQMIVNNPNTEGETLVLTNVGENECFGEMSIFDDLPRSASAICRAPSTILEFHKADLFDYFEKDNFVGMVIMKNLGAILSFRLRMSDEELLRNPYI